MADQIRVLIVDDIPETRDHLSKLLGFESDIEVVGSAASGREAIEMAARLTPDVVLMDINMPDMDGISATERLSSEVPTAAVVMMSVQGEADYLRRSMLAGAREFLVKPFSSDELTSSIRQVYTREREKQSRIAVAPPPAPAGGGRATAVAVRPRRRARGRRARPRRRGVRPQGRRRAHDARRQPRRRRRDRARPADLSSSTRSFQFGDIGVLLNLNPKNKSIADIIPELEHGEIESLDTFVINHSAGIKVLLAPPSPEMAELITPAGAKRMIEALRAEQRPRGRRLHVHLQRHHPCHPRPGGYRADDALARDHVDQEHPPLPRSGRSARVRARTRSGSSSIAPIRRWASASPTWSTRSGGAWITRSSPMAGASCTPSTGACHSSSPTERRRSHRTCCASPRPWLARSRKMPTSPAARPVRRSRCSRGDDAAARTMAAHGRRGVTDVPLEADRKRSTRHGLRRPRGPTSPSRRRVAAGPARRRRPRRRAA